jgi:ribosomal protein S18 acetylase RimI-like enzyme
MRDMLQGVTGPDSRDIEIRRARAEDLDEMASVLGAAFADYPATRWTVDARDHVARVTGLQRLSLERLGLPFGEAWVAQVDDTIVSVAVWMDSRVPIPGSVWQAMADEQRALEGDRAAASIAADQQLDGLRPTIPHLYLGAVGTVPAARNRGLARRVLDVLLAAADAEAVAVYLETSTTQNVAFYASMGFGVTERIDIAHGPTTWAMLRPSATDRPVRHASDPG